MQTHLITYVEVARWEHIKILHHRDGGHTHGSIFLTIGYTHLKLEQPGTQEDSQFMLDMDIHIGVDGRGVWETGGTGVLLAGGI